MCNEEESPQYMPQTRQGSIFFPDALRSRARQNIARYEWAGEVRTQTSDACRPWIETSDDDLWAMVFGNTITRSWMVWSEGWCPSCRNDVRMYAWQMDAFALPWKVRCPHCQDLFPKNDFRAYYGSGLDAHGVFDPARADRSLLFNEEHPDLSDPLWGFGVDDGEGYVDQGNRWRFVGAYLIYAQWKGAILAGIRALSAAYTLTGDAACAHKALVLLDRVADLYPTFDFGKEGVVYEQQGRSGYVSTWHDSCEETREMVLAYDQVREALLVDEELVAFLSGKAREFALDNPKTSPADIRRNIEGRILQDALDNPEKIYSNYPRTEIAKATIHAVLDWPGKRNEVCRLLDDMLKQATAVDGLTGEKGLAGYSSFTIQGIALLLAMFDRIEPDFLRETLVRHPRLREMYRFHIDTWCFRQYYPNIGDTGSFARKSEQYVGVGFTKPGLDSSIFFSTLSPSMYSFLWRLYDLTGDASFVDVLYHANGRSVEGLPWDLFAEDPETFQQAVRNAVDREGSEPRIGSVNKEEWHLALLRCGQGANERVLWIDYDSGERHSHADGMNIGFFGRGLDLMPDFGYPPVQYGGWGGPRFNWYLSTAAHNTVVVDGKNQPGGRQTTAGTTTMWVDDEELHAIRVSGPALIDGPQFERTVAMVDISDEDSYLLDIFRVVGGTDHAKFQHSHFGRITTQGLSLVPAEDYGYETQMRSFLRDPSPQPGWNVDWEIEDRHGYLPQGASVHFRYTDLSTDVQALTCEGWIALGYGGKSDEAWIPRVIARRQSVEAPLSSTFVAILEPYESVSAIAGVRRLPLKTEQGEVFPDANVAVEVQLVDGRTDLLIAMDAENPMGLRPSLETDRVAVQPEWGVRLDGEMCLVRRSLDGAIAKVMLCKGNSVKVGDVALRNEDSVA